MKSLNRKKPVVLCLLLEGLAVLLVLSPTVGASSFGVFNLTEENALQSNYVKDVFIYDITMDSTDYTTWYDDSNKSWWQEVSDHNLLLWNKLGSDAEVTNSEVGPDGVIVGAINYLPGKFGNGFKPQPRTGDRNLQTNCIRYDGLNLWQKGCIEFWFQPDWVSGGHIRHILSFAKPDGGLLISFHYNDWQNKLNLSIWDGNGYDYVGRYIIPASTPEWSTTEPFHIAIVWDGTAANNTDKFKLFLNGTERGTLVSRGTPTFADWGSGNDFWLATRWAPGDWDRHHWEGTDGVMDNIKIWDYAKTDFEDRFVEHINQAPIWPDGSTLTDSNVGLTSLALVWTPADHNIGVAEYLLFEDSEFIDNVTGEVLSYEVNGLDPNTEYTFKVEACDGEGNCSTDGPSATVRTLTPVEATGQLVVEVLALNLQGGIENSLDAKLDTVLKSLDDLNTNNDVAAINSLQAFINAVEAQRGHKIPEADADNLIAAAQEIIDLLSAEQTE